MPNLDALRSDDGTLPAYAWPGGYPLIYVTHGGLVVCPNCANEPDTSDPVVASDVYWEGAPVLCDGCGKPVESAYGDPDNEDADLDATPDEPPEVVEAMALPLPDAAREAWEQAVRDEEDAALWIATIPCGEPLADDDGTRATCSVTRFTEHSHHDLTAAGAIAAGLAEPDPFAISPIGTIRGDDEVFDVTRCVACGDVIDYCQGHGEIGDPLGFAILTAHDNDDHGECDPRGCDVARDLDIIAESCIPYCTFCGGEGHTAVAHPQWQVV